MSQKHHATVEWTGGKNVATCSECGKQVSSVSARDALYNLGRKECPGRKGAK